ncbi:MAG: hypothetical protein M1838_000126 [Thelocarpon superellum]|nr:MAG: hypothetical protein M1838_000126 [Thelocarpon superellum]
MSFVPGKKSKEARHVSNELLFRHPPEHRKRQVGKSLFELAAERRARLVQESPSLTQTPASKRAAAQLDDDAEVDEAALGPFAQAFFYSLTLTMLHFTLDVLVHHQYRQDVDWNMIVRRTAVTFPLVLGLVYTLHPVAQTHVVPSQLFFFVVSVAAGCYLIYATNVQGYFAVMKRAPPLGTLWVWSVVELKLPSALLSLIVAVLYLLYGNYSLV